MTIDEQELHRRLQETAAQATAPRFTAVDVVRQIGRRRSRVTGAVAGAAVAATAIAVAVPTMLNGTGLNHVPRPPGRPGIGRQVIIGPPPAMSVTVNGQTQASPAHYVIAPGENLTIVLEVTVPAHKLLSALWVGVTNGLLTPTLEGPANMSPILAAYRTPLGPGVHQFRLHWVTPGGMSAGTSRQLSVEWLYANSAGAGARGEGVVAELNVPGVSGA
jgi:hypothetical protein